MRKLIILLCVTFLLISCREDPVDLTKSDISAEYYEKLEKNILVKIEDSPNRYYLKIGDSVKEVADVSNTDIVAHNSAGFSVLFCLLFLLVGAMLSLSCVLN